MVELVMSGEGGAVSNADPMVFADATDVETKEFPDT